MADNLSSLGFVFDSDQALREGVGQLANQSVERLVCANGEYAIWRSRSGAELWFHLMPAEPGSEERDVIGLTPFFEGRSEVVVRVTGPVRRADDNALEGAFHAWVLEDEAEELADGDDGSVAGAYPLVFDAVDFAARAGGTLPATWRVRFAAVARDLAAHPSEEAFVESSESGLRLAPQAFIPMGLFARAASEAEADAGKGDGPGHSEPPSSTAILTGTVLDHEVLSNEATGGKFHWLLVRSDVATFDVLADPRIVKGEISVGGTVECACWLVGRCLD